MSGCREDISNVRDCQGDASFTYPLSNIMVYSLFSFADSLAPDLSNRGFGCIKYLWGVGGAPEGLIDPKRPLVVTLASGPYGTYMRVYVWTQ